MYAEHVNRKIRARKEKEKEKKTATENHNTYAATFDLHTLQQGQSKKV